MLSYLVLKCCNTFRRLASADFSDRLLYTCTVFVYVSDLKIGKLKSTLFVELLCLFFRLSTCSSPSRLWTIRKQFTNSCQNTWWRLLNLALIQWWSMILWRYLHCHKIQIEREARRESSKRGEWGAGWGVGFFRVLWCLPRIRGLIVLDFVSCFSKFFSKFKNKLTVCSE